jgi:CSLREA domain-containing protein
VVDRAVATLQAMRQRARSDRAHQVRLGAMTVVMLAVVAVVALLWPRPPQGPRPRDPAMTVLPDGRSIGGLSLWPAIDLRPQPGNPAMKPGAEGSWYEIVSDPAIVDLGADIFIYYGGTRDQVGEPSMIGLAESPNGKDFHPYVLSNPRLVGDSDGFDAWAVGMPVLVADDPGWCLYYAGDQAPPFGEGLAIGRATSNALEATWSRNAEPALEPGNPGEWDSCSVVPGSVVVAERGYRLYYLGSSQDDCGRWMVGMARSADGVEWTRYDDPATRNAPYSASDPVLVPGEVGAWDAYSLSDAIVHETGLGWEMFYTGEDEAGRRAIGYAWSRDGIVWDKHPDNPIMKPEDDPYATNALQVHAVTVAGPAYRIYYDYGPTGGLGIAEGRVHWPIVVDTLKDELKADGRCSLREAIEAANLDQAVDACLPGTGHDRVILPAGIYVLSLHGSEEDGNQAGDLDILDDLTLVGNGPEVTVIDGDGADRVVDNLGATLSIDGLTLTNGREVLAAGFGGGGLLNRSGIVTIENCIISRNTASWGGGVTNQPVMAGDSATMEIDHTRIVSNTATGNGGGIFNVCKIGAADSTTIMTITQSTVAGNIADGSLREYFAGNGGGIASGINTRSEGSTVALAIIDSTVSDNVAGGTGQYWMGSGGGLFVVSGKTTILNSTVSGNQATGTGPGGGDGGGIWVCDASTFSDARIANTTVSGNTAVSGGGGISAISMDCYCRDTPDPAAVCGAVTISTEGPTVSVHDTIVANNQVPIGNGCLVGESTFVSRGWNIEDGGSCNLDQATDLRNIDAQLGPLADNGGPTWTHAPLSGSPAVDAGSCAETTTDQRGYPRPVDLPSPPNAADGCDIGAVEVQADSAHNGPLRPRLLAYHRAAHHARTS